jgi:hypothetical protein
MLLRSDRPFMARRHNGSMKLLTEYLERAVSLEQLAAGEQHSKFKDDLLRQAAAYRILAKKRACDYGLPAPSPPENTD